MQKTTVRIQLENVANVLAEIKRLCYVHNLLRKHKKNEEGQLRLYRNAMARIDTLNMLGLLDDEQAEELENMFYE